MKKFLLTLLTMTLLTTVAFAAEETVDYGDTTYVYGGQACETTDDNENELLEGLILRGVDQATYYTAGDGFLYFTPAAEDAPAILILDNATIIADYCIQAVTDVDLILVGENLLQANAYFCFNAVEAYDENMEPLNEQDVDYGTLTITGDGSLQAICAGQVAFSVGQFAMHSGALSVTLDGDAFAGIVAVCDYEANDLSGFLMDGGTLDIDLGQQGGWGIEVNSADTIISGGAITISGGASDSIGFLSGGKTKDATVSIIGGSTIIDNDGTVSFSNVKFTSGLTMYTVVDFTDAEDGVFTVKGLFQFSDTADIYADAGTVVISAFDASVVEGTPNLNVTGLSDYLYCMNEFTTFDLDETTLTGFTASIVGQPDINLQMRSALVFPYTTERNLTIEYTFTRAQAIALLWDSMGQTSSAIDNPFTDVNADDGYYDAILWAVEAGITTGTTATTFDPDALCTKGQLLTFLYRNAGTPEVDVENIFTDVSENSYLHDAVLWGIANTMMDAEAELFDAASTVLSDGAVGYLICMGQ
ncbi:S-layer homology domain-containing protein [Bengtsoniella intestinalis]|uniref:S-layer homology domain-containing protein n=1 Tax=Bengtsoniella intestinalis TaxID=3073143 RepID=UPI00391F3FD5